MLITSLELHEGTDTSLGITTPDKKDDLLVVTHQFPEDVGSKVLPLLLVAVGLTMLHHEGTVHEEDTLLSPVFQVTLRSVDVEISLQLLKHILQRGL